MSSSCERNKEPIAKVLDPYLKKLISFSKNGKINVLEIASGDGTHVNYFSKLLYPLDISWQPTELKQETVKYIRNRTYAIESPNVMPALCLDVSLPPEQWPITVRFDAVLCVNMLHISPIECAYGLFRGAEKVTSSDGILFTYGPYAIDGNLSPDSNVAFDTYLKRSDSRWGIRDICFLKEIALPFGWILDKIYDMPANNKTLIWKRHQEVN